MIVRLLGAAAAAVAEASAAPSLGAVSDAAGAELQSFSQMVHASLQNLSRYRDQVHTQWEPQQLQALLEQLTALTAAVLRPFASAECEGALEGWGADAVLSCLQSWGVLLPSRGQESYTAWEEAQEQPARVALDGMVRGALPAVLSAYLGWRLGCARGAAGGVLAAKFTRSAKEVDPFSAGDAEDDLLEAAVLLLRCAVPGSLAMLQSALSERLALVAAAAEGAGAAAAEAASLLELAAAVLCDPPRSEVPLVPWRLHALSAAAGGDGGADPLVGLLRELSGCCALCTQLVAARGGSVPHAAALVAAAARTAARLAPTYLALANAPLRAQYRQGVSASLSEACLPTQEGGLRSLEGSVALAAACVLGGMGAAAEEAGVEVLDAVSQVGTCSLLASHRTLPCHDTVL